MTINVWISTLRFSASFVIRTQEGKQTLHCVMEGIVQGAMSQFLLWTLWNHCDSLRSRACWRLVVVI